jgi:hypothetical protein
VGHEFTLVLDGVGYLPDDTIEALYEATGGDAGIEHGPDGVFVTLERDADSLAAAIARTVSDLETVPGTAVVGVSQDDGVTLADIARRLGRSRESVRLYAAGKRGPGGFPRPEWASSSGERFWWWVEVAGWFRDALGADVEVPPHELRTADRLLGARAALRDEDESDRAELVGLLP